MAGAALTLVARGDLARGDLASNMALEVAVTAYATLGALIVRRAGNLIGCFPAVVFTVAFMFLLFPTGTLPSRRWRPVAAVGLILAVLTTAGLVVHPRMVALIAPGGASLTYRTRWPPAFPARSCARSWWAR